MDALVLDEYATNMLASAVFDKDWFGKFLLPPELEKIKRIEKKSIVYLLSDRADENSELLVVDTTSRGVFSSSSKPQYLFDRILQVALSYFDHAVSIPIGWKPYHEGTMLSVYAYSSTRGSGERLYVDRSNVNGIKMVFAFAVTESVENFYEISRDEVLLEAVSDGYIEALLSPKEDQKSAENGSYGISLTAKIPANFTYGATLFEWYEKKLTIEQRAFVDKGYDQPVRLRGAAGTGKTLAMVVKLLKDAYQKEEEGESFDFAFITHSWATGDMVRDIILSLDVKKMWRNMDHVRVRIGSLYDLAQELLSYDFKKLKPLSTDGTEGRELQYELTESILRESLKNARFKLSILKCCSEQVREWVESESRQGSFLSELMNEFACVIDSENIRLGTKQADNYIARRREPWQMPLPTEADRRMVLHLHEKYLDELREMEVFSIDQMIGDLSQYMNSHEWEYVRETKGFDAIFVDELHYFSRPERMVLHDLIKKSAITEQGKAPMFMAYDLKQSTNDHFLGQTTSGRGRALFGETKTGQTDLVELTKVFRYTPEIAEFITDLDGTFPALDLEGEWGDLRVTSNKEQGEHPRLIVYENNIKLIDQVFSDALREAKSYGGREVAVLCLNDELFSRYLVAGRIKDKFVPVASRDQLPDIRYAKKKCIFSMPDYVAGMQFSSVYLIHADAAEEDNDECMGAQRRFVSRVYLGASRASNKLIIVSSEERRGAAKILSGPVNKGSLIKG